MAKKQRWLADKVVDVGIYGSKVAEGSRCSTLVLLIMWWSLLGRHVSCFYYSCQVMTYWEQTSLKFETK